MIIKPLEDYLYLSEEVAKRIIKEFKQSVNKLLRFKDIKKTHDAVIEKNNEDYRDRIIASYKKRLESGELNPEFEHEYFKHIRDWINIDNPEDHSWFLIEFISHYFASIKEIVALTKEYKQLDDEGKVFDALGEQVIKLRISHQDASNVEKQLNEFLRAKALKNISTATVFIEIVREKYRNDRSTFAKPDLDKKVHKDISKTKKIMNLTMVPGIYEAHYALGSRKNFEWDPYLGNVAKTKNGALTLKEHNPDGQFATTTALIELDRLLKNTGGTVQQTFLYLLHELKANGYEKSFKLHPNRYFGARDLNDNKKTRHVYLDRLFNDLDILARSFFEFEVIMYPKKKGQRPRKKTTTGVVLEYTKVETLDEKGRKGKLDYIEVHFGQWFSDLKEVQQYTLMHEDVLKINSLYHPWAVNFCVKLNERWRSNQSKRKGEWEKLSVKTLLEIAPLNEDEINKELSKRSVYSKDNRGLGDRLEKNLDIAAEAAKFLWHYERDNNTKADFLNNNILFKPKDESLLTG